MSLPEKTENVQIFLQTDTVWLLYLYTYLALPCFEFDIVRVGMPCWFLLHVCTDEQEKAGF